MSIDVSFSDQSTPGPSGPITAWAWDFGDTGTSTEQNPIHTYAAAGTYPVHLTVTGSGTDGTASVTHSVPVADPVGGGGASFLSLTSWARPAFTPVRSVGFATKAELVAAITDMQAGDYIHYTGTGVLTISSSTGAAYTLTNKNPASVVVIDLGTSRSIWEPGNVSGDYVKFAYTGSSNIPAFQLNNCSNLHIYGGDITTGIGGVGILVNALVHDCLWYDFAVHNVGSSGLAIRGSTSGGVASAVYSVTFRGEIDRFAMNPYGWDTHNDKGTGMHGCILHGTIGKINNSTFAIYAHDPLRPGETSAGKTYGEGAGGSVIEIGQSPAGSGNENNNLTCYALGENMLMRPDGHSNPGSTGTGQTGGNVINLWGPVPLNGLVLGWLEGTNCTGAIVDGTGENWKTASPMVTVDHGRSTNVNQWTGGSNISEPYDSRWGVVYNDCT